MRGVLLLLVALVCVVPVSAHLEDYCVYPAHERAADNITNFFHAASDHGCKYGSYRPECVGTVLKSASATFAYSSPCRGAVHFDSVYVVSVALGVLPEFAYWLAAFSQAIDFVQFRAVDSCGRDQGPGMMTPPLRGLMRTSAPTGGSVRHLGMPYGLTKSNGLDPDLNSTAEGTLRSFRAWARGESPLLCTNGLTEEVAGIPFGGARCAEGRWCVPQVNKVVQGPIPANYTPYKLGEQVLHYECEGNPSCDPKQGISMINTTLASSLDAYLAGSPFGRLRSGATVPAVVARMGFYMHMLADRASHYWCTDSEKSGMVPDPTQPSNFTSKLDMLKCNFVTHAMQHFWEQGVDQPLADQSWAALNLYYKELQSFKEMPGSELYFNSSAVVVSRDELIGDPKAPGPLPRAIVKRDVDDRVSGLHRLIKSYGWAPVPGFETTCNGSDW